MATEIKTVEIKIFDMNGNDWIAASSVEEAVAEFKRIYNGDEQLVGELEPTVVSLEAMRRLTYHDEEGGDAHRTFEEQLQKIIADGETFPCLFASADY